MCLMKPFLKVFAALLAASLLASCSGIGKMELLEYRIKEANAESFHAVHGVVGLHIANYGPALKFTDIHGQFYHGEQLIGTLLVDDLDVQGHGSAWVDAYGHLMVEDNVSLFTVLNLASNFNPADYNITVYTKVKMGIFSMKVEKKNIPLADLIKK